MFVILTYDVGEKRVNKVRKIVKKYLVWTQNSVFEGEITIGNLKQCLAEIYSVIDKHYDSIYVYKVKNAKNIVKEVYGTELNFDDMFL